MGEARKFRGKGIIKLVRYLAKQTLSAQAERGGGLIIVGVTQQQTAASVCITRVIYLHKTWTPTIMNVYLWSTNDGQS